MRRVIRRAVIVACGVAALSAVSPPASATIVTWNMWLERFLSGLSVHTRQISATAEQNQTVIKNAMLASTSAQTTQAMALRTAAIKNAYAYETGQGQTACAVAASRAGISSSEASQVAVGRAVRDGDASWLQSGGDGASRMGQSLAMRVGHYCTAEEATVLGTTYCQSKSSNAQDAADSSASPFLVNRSYGTEEVLNAAAYVDVLAPLPTVAVDRTDVQGRANLMQSRLDGSIASAARAAMMDVAVSGMGGNAPQ